jgi:hypothetical protein
MRKQKVIRLNYIDAGLINSPCITLFDKPYELRLSVGPKSFVSIKEDSVTIGGGAPSKINVQGFSNTITYASMVQDLPFPLNLLPVTPFTPLPNQIISPPFKELIPILKQAATIASSIIG